MTKKAKILSIIIAVVATLGVIGMGVTLALTSSDNRSNGSLTTADLNLTATAKDVEVYSAVAAPANADEADKFYDEHGNAYVYRQSTQQGSNVIPFDEHGGSVSYDDKSVTVSHIMPGDKVVFKIAVTSTSTISFNYRAELLVDATSGQELLNEIDFSAGDLGIVRKDVTEQAESANGVPVQAVLTDYTEWDAVAAHNPNVDTVTVTISLPITATKGQDSTVKFYYVVRGIQNTVAQGDVVRFSTDDGEVGFDNVAEAVDYAKAHGITEIPIVGNTVLEEGTIVLDNAYRFVGKPDENGNFHVLKGARFVITNGASASFTDIAFEGDSYIDVSDCTALTLDRCYANVNSVLFVDSRTREESKAFVVSGNVLTPVRLTLTNNNLTVKNGSAATLHSPLRSGTAITDNRFGSAVNAYTSRAILEFADIDVAESVVSVTGNEFYGTPLYIGKAGATPYLVVSQNNKAYYGEGAAFVLGNSGAAFADSGSTVNGNALTIADVSDALLFGGADVSLNSINRIASGKITVSDSLSLGEFFVKYTAGEALANNAITLYKNGSAYAYLNVADNDEGYVLSVITND